MKHFAASSRDLGFLFFSFVMQFVQKASVTFDVLQQRVPSNNIGSSFISLMSELKTISMHEINVFVNLDRALKTKS